MYTNIGFNSSKILLESDILKANILQFLNKHRLTLKLKYNKKPMSLSRSYFEIW